MNEKRELSEVEKWVNQSQLQEKENAKLKDELVIKDKALELACIDKALELACIKIKSDRHPIVRGISLDMVDKSVKHYLNQARKK